MHIRVFITKNHSMKDFNLHKFLRNNPLTKTALKNGKIINEAFEGFGGVRGIAAIGDGVLNEKSIVKEEDPWGWDKHVAQMRDDEQDRPNKWIMNIDRMPSVDGWSASWENPGVISWSHPEVPSAVVVATPGWDGPGTPVEFQSDAGSMQMLKILDQDTFDSFEDYVAAIKPYLDMVYKANTEDISLSGGIEDTFQDGSINETMTASKGWQYDDDENEEDFAPMTSDERIMGLGGDQLLSSAQSLVDDGYDIEDIVDFLRANVR